MAPSLMEFVVLGARMAAAIDRGDPGSTKVVKSMDNRTDFTFDPKRLRLISRTRMQHDLSSRTGYSGESLARKVNNGPMDKEESGHRPCRGRMKWLLSPFATFARPLGQHK